MKTLDLCFRLFERYEKVEKVGNYYGLLALYALAQVSCEAKDDAQLQKCVDMLALYPDRFDHPHYNFSCYKAGGNGKAWLVYQGLWNEERETIRKYAEMTRSAPADAQGILCHPQFLPDRNRIWIDVVYAVTPFMLYAGLALEEEAYIDFAAEQCFKMYETFLDRTCGLLHQSRGFMQNPKLVSHDHWSRGNGWGYLGLTALVAHLPKNSKHRLKAEAYFKDLSEALIAFQTEKGVWRQEIPCDYAWDESSGTGLIAYGLGVGLRLGLLDKARFQEPFEKAIDAIVTHFIRDDFSTTMCCCGCLCPGEGADKGTVKSYLTVVRPVTDEHHSYGCLMLALLEAHRNGICAVSK